MFRCGDLYIWIKHSVEELPNMKWDRFIANLHQIPLVDNVLDFMALV